VKSPYTAKAQQDKTSMLMMLAQSIKLVLTPYVANLLSSMDEARRRETHLNSGTDIVELVFGEGAAVVRVDEALGWTVGEGLGDVLVGVLRVAGASVVVVSSTSQGSVAG